MITRAEGWQVGIDQEFGVDMYTLLYLKQITNKDLLYSTGNSQYSAITYMGKEFLKEQLHAELNHFAVYLN